MSYVERELREELNTLSKEIFGVSSKWQKLMKGMRIKATKTVEEVVPGEEVTVKHADGTETKEMTPATTRTVQVPLLTEHGAEYSVVEYKTAEEVLEQLKDMKVQLDNFRAQMKAQQEEQAAKKAQADAEAKVKEAAVGSAV
jgi:hypothetical protein